METYKTGSDVWNKENLELNSSPNTLIISDSGKGKSSLISAIYGIRHDYQGSIYFDNTPISQLTIKEWSKLRQKEISIVFQSLNLFPEISAWQNVELKNNLLGYKSKQQIEELFDLLGMSPYKNQQAKSLSFGQQQRIAIIRSLCQPYACLLLDEPFSHLDATNSKSAWELIKRESEQQGAKIIIAALSQDSYIDVNQVYKL